MIELVEESDGYGQLRRVAEEASGHLRRLADDIDLVAEHLPSRDRARRAQLGQTATRLRLTADTLSAEAQASSPSSAAHAAAIGRKILRTALPFVVALGTGITSAASQQAYNHFTEHQPAALECLNQIDLIVQSGQYAPPNAAQRKSINRLAERVTSALRSAQSAGIGVDFPWNTPNVAVTGEDIPLASFVSNLGQMARVLLETLPYIEEAIEDTRGESRDRAEHLYEEFEPLLNDVVHLQAELTDDF